jgi:hypothetical protein
MQEIEVNRLASHLLLVAVHTLCPVIAVPFLYKLLAVVAVVLGTAKLAVQAVLLRDFSV